MCNKIENKQQDIQRQHIKLISIYLYCICCFMAAAVIHPK